jgi:hypothetical protein
MHNITPYYLKITLDKASPGQMGQHAQRVGQSRGAYLRMGVLGTGSLEEEQMKQAEAFISRNDNHLGGGDKRHSGRRIHCLTYV